MSLKLPPADSPIREKFDMNQLVEAGRNPRNLPTFREALSNGRSFLGKTKGASAVNKVKCMNHNLRMKERK